MFLLRWRWGVCRLQVQSQHRFLRFDGVGPQCPVAGRRWSWSEWRGCLWVGGIVGLLVEGALEEAVGLAWAAVLAAPEATELGCLDGITWHGELE